MPAGIGELLSNMAAQSLPPRRRGRRKVIDNFRPRSPGGAKWLWPVAGWRCSFQRESVGARGDLVKHPG